MNTLLIFFALPIAVIIISAILQKLLNNPFIVAALIFAIFSFLTAILVSLLCRLNHNNCGCTNLSNVLNNNTGNNSNNNNNNTCGCRCNRCRRF